jgi:hypothetical protein
MIAKIVMGLMLLLAAFGLAVKFHAEKFDKTKDELDTYSPTAFADDERIFAATFPNPVHAEGRYELRKAEGRELVGTGRRFCGYSAQLVSCVATIRYESKMQLPLNLLSLLAALQDVVLQNAALRQLYFAKLYQDFDKESLTTLELDPNSRASFKAFGFNGARIGGTINLNGQKYPTMLTMVIADMHLVFIHLTDVTGEGWKSEAANAFNSSFQILIPLPADN